MIYARTTNPDALEDLRRQGYISMDLWNAAIAETRRPALEAIYKSFEEADQELSALARSCDEKFGDAAPSFTNARDAFREMKGVLDPILRKKREQEPDAAPPGTQEEPAQVQALSSAKGLAKVTAGLPSDQSQAWAEAEELIRGGMTDQGLARMAALAANEASMRARFLRKLMLADVCLGGEAGAACPHHPRRVKYADHRLQVGGVGEFRAGGRGLVASLSPVQKKRLQQRSGTKRCPLYPALPVGSLAGVLELRGLAAMALLLSLFDRLTDEDPRTTVEAPKSEWEQLAAFKRGVARDLTYLLNTRINESHFPDNYELMRQSVVAYGVQDYTRSPVEQDDIRRSIERAIRQFEPRLSRVQVQLFGVGHLELHFRISAFLKADLGSDAVLFDAELPKQTRRFQVSEQR